MGEGAGLELHAAKKAILAFFARLGMKVHAKTRVQMSNCTRARRWLRSAARKGASDGSSIANCIRDLGAQINVTRARN
eukprot:12414268-Alexandrium_andersonii.AAC.1